ncbi:chitin binding peritrophin-A domain-containing protein [Kitasatospora sp. NPDC096077]|uniref:chitin binding peritrophin-A domain-containing protein n=1 Tax=Kitasatospora sp. NPDC096077 TaxID=3155544 RepID=UPI0033342EC6
MRNRTSLTRRIAPVITAALLALPLTLAGTTAATAAGTTDPGATTDCASLGITIDEQAEYPADTHYYWQCAGTIAYLKECPLGSTGWNPATQRCEYATTKN